MDWDNMRRQWQAEIPPASAVSVEELQSRDRQMQRKVRRRDLIETLAAAFVGICFAVAAVRAATAGDWPVAAFALLLVAHSIFLPLRLHRARRRMPTMEHRLSLIEHLGLQREAALVQARMWEQAWLWYFAPIVAGLIGLTLASRGASSFGLAYSAAVLVTGAVATWYARREARKRFRAHADRLQRQIDDLTGNGRS